MKILLLCNKLPYPPKDGGAIASLNILKGLSVTGYKSEVFAINTAKHYFDLHKIPSEILLLAKFNAIYLDTSIKPIKLLSNLLFSKSPYNALRFISNKVEDKLSEIVKNGDFDIIQLEGLYMCPYINTIKKNSTALIVFRPHNIEYEIWERITANTRNCIRKYYLRNLTRRLKIFEKSYINKYDAIVPITQRDANKFIELGNHRDLHVAPAGIYPELYIPKVQDAETVSLFHIGGLDWEPNLEGLKWFVKHCWPILNSKFPNLKFHIAGRNANPKFIKKILAPNIIFDGEVEDAIEYINGKSILIIPIFSGSGMRIKLLEGMALEKPIISTSVGAEGIEVKNESNILIADTVSEFIDAVTRMVEDRELRTLLGKNARVFVESHYNNKDICASLSNFYEQLIDSHKKSR